jgi:triosephosphate isomerase (TIM)
MTGRRPLMAGNWKMHTTPAEAAELARALRATLQDPPAVDMAVFPPFLSIPPVLDVLKASDIAVGGQDLHAEPKGAYTGNVSGEMLKAAGCRWALIGHSERRAYEKESGELLASKVRAAMRAELSPMFCCGETLDQRRSGKAMEIVQQQLDEGLGWATASEMERIVLAYEPVWAIGTGVVASPEQAQEIHAAIRGWIKSKWGDGTARVTRILYGGSVKPGNVTGIMAQPDIDGALVGGAALKAESFDAIVRFKTA